MGFAQRRGGASPAAVGQALAGLLAFLLGVIGSSRARDARGAQSLVALIVFPLLGFISPQVTGVLWFTAG